MSWLRTLWNLHPPPQNKKEEKIILQWNEHVFNDTEYLHVFDCVFSANEVKTREHNTSEAIADDTSYSLPLSANEVQTREASTSEQQVAVADDTSYSAPQVTTLEIHVPLQEQSKKVEWKSNFNEYLLLFLRMVLSWFCAQLDCAGQMVQQYHSKSAHKSGSGTAFMCGIGMLLLCQLACAAKLRTKSTEDHP